MLHQLNYIIPFFVLGFLLISSVVVEKRLVALGVFPFLTFCLLYYFVFYALVPFIVFNWQNEHHKVFTVNFPFPHYLDIKTIVFLLIFVLAQISAYLVSITYFVRRIERGGSENPLTKRLETVQTEQATSETPRPDRSYEKISPVILLAIGSIVLHFMLTLSARNGISLPGLAQLNAPLWYFGFSVFSYFALQQKLNLFLIIFYIIALIFNIIFSIWGGLLTPIVFNIALFAGVSFFLNRYKIFLVCSILFILILPGYGYFKCFYQLEIVGQPTKTTESGCSSLTVVLSLANLARRSVHLNLFQHVVSHTPSKTPHWGAEPISRTLLNHIPRVLWPNKPEERLGNKFGKIYGILLKTDNKTSWNVPWVSDFYRASGFAWLPIYGLVTGLLIGLGVGWMSVRENKQFWFGVYMASLFPLFYQESNFSLMAGSVLWVILVLCIGFKMAQLTVAETKKLFRSNPV